MLATEPVDLPPGQTTAQLAWEPSDGPVSGYLVFESRGESGFLFDTFVEEPSVRIEGVPGDSVRILVVAQGMPGTFSTASPPSPPVRFHAAAEVASATQAVTDAPPPTATNALLTSTSDTSNADAGTALDAPPEETATAQADATASDASTPEEVSTSPFDRALRERLLSADARFPRRPLSPEANRWIQSRVEEQIRAGVALAGSGELDGDGLRELVWVDPAGQLFVSTGTRLVEAEDPATTFDESLRLRATERFVGLADFDGDGRGDWLIEDTLEGGLWIVAEETLALSTEGRSLAGHGDFDGDGQSELLWQQQDLSYRLGRPGMPLLEPEWIPPVDAAGASYFAAGSLGSEDADLLAVADVDGNGRDDLLFRGADGRLWLARSVSTDATPRFEWSPGPDREIDRLELVATLDFDRNGSAEIAWWNGDDIEIWNLQDLL